MEANQNINKLEGLKSRLNNRDQQDEEENQGADQDQTTNYDERNSITLGGSKRGMRVFVTVGTTEFGGLVRAVCSHQVQKILKDLGFSSMNIQAGKTMVDVRRCLLPTSIYDYKPSLQSDMSRAQLVISHAGAGTCLEVLELRKLLVVVVNDTLMDNHQLELAQKLAEDGYLEYATLSSLEASLLTLDKARLACFPGQDKTLLSDFLHHRLEMN